MFLDLVILRYASLLHRSPQTAVQNKKNNYDLAMHNPSDGTPLQNIAL